MSLSLSSHRAPLALLFATAAVTCVWTTTAHAENDALDQLLENVKYWEERGRPDKAAEIWQKVLRSDPNHPGALSALALYAARGGKKAEAEGYLRRLEAAHPRHPKIAAIKQAIGIGNQYDDLLAEARALVKAGRLDDAIAAYRKVFGANAPSGELGLEFYQTLGGTDSGWEEARAGLERLNTESGGSARTELALARHLSYREGTRRDGVKRLARLAAEDGGDKAVVASWKRALMWLHASRADVPLFQAYLKVSPGDAEVEKRVSELMAGEIQARAEDAERKRIEDGYQALKDKDLKTAERLFSKATAKKEDLDALVGLSVVALQQEQFDKAVVILQKVKQLAPQRKELWERSLESAEFWDLVTRAKKAVAADKWDEAEQLLGDAIKRNKKEAHHARMLLGNVYVKKGEMEKAEDLFDAMVQEDPKNVPALKALVELYLEAHRGKRAIEVNDKLAALDASAAYDPAWLRAETMRYDASELRKTGDLDGAKELLEVARQTSPTNKRVLYDYAYLAVNMSDTQTARGAVSALRDLEEPGSIDLIILEAWVFEAEGRYNAALELLDRVPKEQLDERTKRLKTRVEVRSTSALALQLAARKPIAARHRLVELQHRVGDDPELLGLVAIAWADLGATDRALTIIYDAIGRAPRGVSTLKLQLAAILHKAGREDELLAVLRELEGDTELSIGERRGLEDLRIAHAVRRADVAREKGDHTRAFNILAIPLRDYPNDPRLMNALGRLFVSAQEHEEALRVFGKVLEALPEDLDARSGAVESAIRMGRLDIADKLLEDGLRLMPNNPRMHAIAGRAAVLRGEDGEAMDSFKKALALDEGQNPTVTVGDSALGDPGYRSMLADAATRFTGDGDGTRGAGSAATLREEVQREMDEIRDRHSSSVGGGFSIRLRDGLPGYGKITEVSVPITLSLSTGYKGRLAFTATPIVMEPGDLDLDDELTQYDYGLNAYDWRIQGNIGGRYPDRGATGIELMLEFNYRAWTIRAGSTPLGFLYQTAVGGIEYRDQFDAVGLRVRLDRTPVKDSVLSYAGERDLLTGAAWGAVTRNGGRVDLSFTDDDMLYYLYGGGFVNIGDRVPSNAGGEVGLGVRWTLYDWEDTKLITGAGASGLFYGQNLRHFTFGQGGYFSPQLFLHAGIPLDLSGGAAKLKYRLGLDLGVNWFTEEATPYFPTDPNRQALLQGLSDEDGFPVASYHEGQRSFAFAVNFEGALQWRITETFDLGVHAEFHTGHDYQEFAGGIFLGYAFDRKKDDDIGRLPLQGF